MRNLLINGNILYLDWIREVVHSTNIGKNSSSSMLEITGFYHLPNM